MLACDVVVKQHVTPRQVLTAVGFTDSEASQATTSSSQVCIHACACCSYMEQIYYSTFCVGF